MTPQEAAARLDGCEYGNEGSKQLWAEMKAAGLVAVFGASDDLMEFRGAVYDEVGCYDGGEARLTRAGLLNNECSEGDCPYFAREADKATPVEAVWGDNDEEGEDGVSWRYETPIPHATFKVKEGEQTYCIGIVFALADVPDPSAEAAARACYDVTVATMASAFPPGLKQRTWDELEEKERVLHRGYARAARAADSSKNPEFSNS